MDGPSDHAIATALQRVLLPPGLPTLEGWAMATLYEPAGHAVLVGGDFYDWFTLPNGNLLFLVGDVSGKGPVAGALGMSIRKALKGITCVVSDVVEALPVLQRALADELAETFATLCLIELTPGSGKVRLVLAGHPPPQWRHEGVFREAPAPANGILGPGVTATWESQRLELAPNDMLVVFSDGLSEARLSDGRQFGEGPFQSLLASLPPDLSSYEVVLQTDQHLRRVASTLDDDVIIGVITYQPVRGRRSSPPETGRVHAMHLAPHSTSPASARRFVADACRSMGIDGATQDDAVLVVSELVTNAVLHARTDIEVRVTSGTVGVRVEVSDLLATAAEVLTDRAGPPDAGTEHGRGLGLVRSVAARFGTERTASGKTVWALLVPSEGR